MHRLPSEYTLRRFRIASVLVLVMFLMIPTFFGFFLSGIILGGNRWFLYAWVALAVALFCMVTNFLLSGRLRCPLCIVPPLASRRCSKHRSATKLFWSHKLKVAHSIIFRNSFRCPYCGEPTVMEARRKRAR